MKLNLYQIASYFLFGGILAFAPLGAKEDPGPDEYTINYNTISIIEYLKFAGKICNTNFIFNAEDLPFTVSVMSDAPITRENVIATLMQMLRIHGLQLLEQDNNFVIHKSTAVRQPATLILEDGKNPSHAALVTRIFRLKNANPDSIAAIIRPMVSDEALLEVSRETRQLILTDVTASVDKVAGLIENLDAPHTPLEIKKFEAKFNKPEYLIELTAQIMNPIAQGNPFILVPQSLANAVFIVSTPELNSKAFQVLKTLDTPPKQEVLAELNRKSDVLLIRLDNHKPDAILKGMKEIAAKMGPTTEPGLLETIDSAKWIRETNSLMFIGSPIVNAKIREFATALNVGEGQMSNQANFYIYKIQSAPPEEIQESLRLFAKNLGKANVNDTIVQAIDTMHYIKETNSLLFTGPDDALQRLHEIVPQFDTGISQAIASSQFLIYKLKTQSGDQLIQSLKETASSLKTSNLVDPLFLRAIESVKWVKNTHSLIFTGDPASLQRVQTLLQELDVVAPMKGYFLYPVQHTTGDLVEEDLDRLAKNMKASGMKDAPLLQVIAKIQYIKETNSLLLMGDPQSVDEVKELIAKYDVPKKPVAGPGHFFMYKPLHKSAQTIEQSLKDVASNLKKSGFVDPNVLSAIDSVKYISSTNALIFTGTPEANEKIQALLKDIDQVSEKAGPIQHLGQSTFLLYKLKGNNGPQLISSLQAMTSNLKKSVNPDKDLLTTLQSIKYVKESNSLMFTGTEEALGKVQTLLDKLDTGSPSGNAPGACVPATNFFIYRPVALQGPDLEKTLLDFADNLQASCLNDPGLFQAIHSMKFIDKTQSLVFTGDVKSLDKVKELLKEFDISSNIPFTGIGTDQQIQGIDNTSFLVYKLQFHKGDEIQNAMRQIAKDLTLSSAPVNQNLLNSINSIQWLEITNSLLCSGDSETLIRLRELLKNLDVPLKQVFIEILVIQTNLTNANQFGLLWGGNLKYKTKFSSAFNNSSSDSTTGSGTWFNNMQTITDSVTPTPNMIPWSQNYQLGVIGDIIMHKGQSFLSLGSLLNALQNDIESTTYLTPKIIAQDSKTSTVFIGQNVPFSGSFVSNSTSSTVSTSNIEYRDIGFNLTITPVLGNSNIITLDISIDTSSISANNQGAQFNFPAGTATGITSNRATMQTTVHVPDKNFLILTGMVNNTNSKQTQGIPCLGGLPLIGAAFSENKISDGANNIVIFMRPTILNSVEDMQTITAETETFFREQTATPYLEQGFNDAMETIKSLDDD